MCVCFLFFCVWGCFCECLCECYMNVGVVVSVIFAAVYVCAEIMVFFWWMLIDFADWM